MNRDISGNAMSVAYAPAHHDVVTALPATPQAVGAARRLLVAEGLDPDIDHTVCLLVSEIVTNSIRHAQMRESDRIIVAARMTPEFARVEVRDPGPGFHPSIRHETDGFGLRMLDTLSSRWGVDHDEAGTRVWFEVDRRRRRFQRG